MSEIKVKAWSPSKKQWRSDWSISTYEEVLDLNKERIDDDLIIVRYAGWKDENNVEIYEGDILSDGEIVGQVFWHDYMGYSTVIGYLAWHVGNPEKPASSVALGSNGHYDRPVWKIIGNIYENPELLS